VSVGAGRSPRTSGSAPRCALTALLTGLVLAGFSGARAVDSTVDPAPGGPDCRLGATRFVPLPLLPVAISERGEVLGIDAARRAARWRPRSGLEELPLPPGFERAEPVALNAHGAVVLVAIAGAGSEERRRAYVVSAGRLIGLGGLGARPFRIDERGRIAGEAVLGTAGRSEPVLWVLPPADPRGRAADVERTRLSLADELAPTPLADCCGGTAKLLDGHGGAAGDLYDAAGHFHAVRWHAGAPAERLRVGERYSSALAMNRRGAVLLVEFPRIWLAGSQGLEPLTLAPHGPSHPHALNDCEMLVGDYGPYSDAARAFVWSRAQGFIDLNTRVDLPPGWTLKSALDVNDRGEIVGRAELPGDIERGFLIEPAGP